MTTPMGNIPEIQFRSLRNLLAIATPEEIDAMVDANVVDVESAKLFLKQLLFALGQMWGSSGNGRVEDIDGPNARQ